MNDGKGPEELVADAVWWIGWKPLVVGGVGATAGIVAGYFRGGMGPMAVAVSVFFVALGLVKPSLLKTGFVASVVAAVAFFVVGAERITDAFETVGLAGLAETVSVLLLEIATFAGAEFEPTRQPTEIVGSAVAGVAFWSLAGAAVGAVVWLVGVYTVNRRHDGIRERLVENAREAGETVLGDDGSLHTLTHGEGSVFLVNPAERYYVANVLVGESSVTLQYGSTVEMASQEVEISDSKKELYYDQISSVDYGGDRLKIRSADGGTVKVVTSEKPVELLGEIDDRLQKYKKRSTSEVEGVDAGDDVSKGGSDSGVEPEPEPEPEPSAETEVTGEEDSVKTGGETEDLGDSIADEVEDTLEAFGNAIEEGEGEDPIREAGIFESSDEKDEVTEGQENDDSDSEEET